MKNLVILGTLAFGIFCGWQLLNGLMTGSHLTRVMQDTLDNAQRKNVNQIRQELIQRAEKEKIPIQSDNIDIEIRLGQKGGLAGGLTQKHGIQTTNKKILLGVTYVFPVLSFPIERRYQLEKNHTIRASVVPHHNYEDYLKE